MTRNHCGLYVNTYLCEQLKIFRVSVYLYSDLQLGDTFVGYQDDTAASVVFQAYHNLQELISNPEISEESVREQVAIEEYVCFYT